MEKLKMFDMTTRQARQWWLITLSILWMEENHTECLKPHPPIPCHGPVLSVQCSATLWAENSFSPYLIHTSMTSPISKGHPDNLNTFHFCLECIKIDPYPSFYFFFRGNKDNGEIFPPKVVSAVPAALPWPLLSPEYVVPLVSSAEHHAIWISAY